MVDGSAALHVHLATARGVHGGRDLALQRNVPTPPTHQEHATRSTFFMEYVQTFYQVII